MKKKAISTFLMPVALITLPLMTACSSNTVPNDTGTSTSQTGQSDQVAVNYKDGTYDSIGSYGTPGGEEQIGVDLSLSHNIITDVQVKTMAIRSISQKKQDAFAANYRPYVIGKNINDVKLSAIAGASLTPNGFNDALDKIKSEAK